MKIRAWHIRPFVICLHPHFRPDSVLFYNGYLIHVIFLHFFVLFPHFLFPVYKLSSQLNLVLKKISSDNTSCVKLSLPFLGYLISLSVGSRSFYSFEWNNQITLYFQCMGSYQMVLCYLHSVHHSKAPSILFYMSGMEHHR